MAVTNITNMITVPEKFSQYVIDRSTEKNVLVSAGIASADPVVAQILNTSPAGGRFVEMPAYNPLEGEDEVFGEEDVSVGNITTKSSHATILFRQRAWGATDLSHVLSGSDPMGAVGQLLGDWWAQREQKIYLSILKGLFDKTNGALKEHINDISAGTDTAAYISASATLDTKQLLGDRYDSLSMVVMHSMTYTYLQKNNMIERQPIFNAAGETAEIQTYLGYRILVDDGMPVNEGVYDTYFLSAGCFARQDGSPAGFVGTETDRDKLGAKDYLINRRCMIVHPRGFSWNTAATLTEQFGETTRSLYYPNNNHLADPANWTLATDHKKIGMACLRHKVG